MASLAASRDSSISPASRHAAESWHHASGSAGCSSTTPRSRLMAASALPAAVMFAARRNATATGSPILAPWIGVADGSVLHCVRRPVFRIPVRASFSPARGILSARLSEFLHRLEGVFLGRVVDVLEREQFLDHVRQDHLG